MHKKGLGMDKQVNWSGKKILIVEDDDSSYIYMSELLKTFQAKLLRSTDGLDAFFVCMTDPPDLVLMDIMLPVLNGVEAIRLIKKYEPSIPIITLSACVMAEDRIQSEKAGGDAFIPKPVFPHDILPVIDYFLTQKKKKEYAVL
jgi:CheY-like chemotaxis protein